VIEVVPDQCDDRGQVANAAMRRNCRREEHDDPAHPVVAAAKQPIES
jgi:hypothetical protein